MKFAVFLAYFSILIMIGASFYKKAQSMQGFLLGNRSLNFWVTALSTHASDMSIWLFMGLPAAIYLQGASEIWTAFGLVIFMFLSWHYVAPTLRQKSEEYKAYTLAGYFEARVSYPSEDSSSKDLLRMTSAGVTIFFLIAYIAAGLVGLGRLFEEILGLNYHVGIITAIGLILVYTSLGGFFAVAWNDMFQAIFLLLMIVLVPCLALRTYDLDLSSLIKIDWNEGMSWQGMIKTFGWGLGYFGLPYTLVKFMSIDKVENLKRAKFLGISWQITVLSAAILVGFIGRETMGNIGNPEMIFINLTHQLLPGILAQVVLCGILAAALSTLDAQVITVSTTISKDLLSLKADQTVWVTRFVMGGLCLVALALAWTNASSIYEMVQYAWTGLGSSFGPLVVVSLSQRKIPAYGALGGMLTGAIFSGLWPFLGSISLEIPAMIPGFFGGLLVIGMASQKNKQALIHNLPS